MDYHNLCYGCFANKENQGPCTFCGYASDSSLEAGLYLTPGTLLSGKYLVGRLLGQGGFGITYLGWDTNLEIRIAIKEFFPQGLVSRVPGENSVISYTGEIKEQFSFGVESFLRESKTLARFEHHPSIVTVRDYFEANNTAYMVMSFIEGITLLEYLNRSGGKIPVEQAIQIVLPVTDALKEVHAAGILHRDISPDNIFIDKEGRVILIDFGAARQEMREKSKSLSVVLKAGYAPEEQYRTKGKQGPWTDIYAVGATLYRCITGDKPPEAIDRLAEDDLVPPSQLGIAIEPDREAALLSALAVKDSDRCQTVEEFQAELLGDKTKAVTEDKAKQRYCGYCGEKLDLKTQLCISCRFNAQQASISSGKPEIAPVEEHIEMRETVLNEAECNEEIGSEPVRSNKPVKVLSFIALLGLVVLGWHFIIDSLYEETMDSPYEEAFEDLQENALGNTVINMAGNTVGNTVNGGLVAKQGDWIYYSNLQDNGYLYKKSSDGNNKTRLNSDDSWFLNVAGDWIYYSNRSDGGKIYRISLDGGSRMKINNDESWSVKVVDGWIYYLNYNSGKRLYKIKTDGSEQKRINDHESWSLNVVGEWLYYRNGRDNSLDKIRNDGSGHTQINSDEPWAINVAGDWIYYSNNNDNRRIYRARTDGSFREPINNDRSVYLNVSEGWIYYRNIDDGGSIYKIKLDGSGRSKVNASNSRFLNVIDEWVYFQNDDAGGQLYKTLADGSVTRRIN